MNVKLYIYNFIYNILYIIIYIYVYIIICIWRWDPEVGGLVPNLGGRISPIVSSIVTGEK